VIKSEHVVEDLAVCLNRMALTIASQRCTVVLRHPERFTPGALEAVVEWMHSVSERPERPWVVATTSVGAELAENLLRMLPVTLTVPPLRHRIDDVRELVPALLGRSVVGRSVSCGPAAMRLLLRGTWPGNVAELAEVLWHALTRRRIGQIQPEDLPESCHATGRRVLTPWEAIERDAIVRTLLETDGDKAAAADLLGISRATIYRKINTYGILVDQR
jgi:DNA-binding NtrC family response regulator